MNTKDALRGTADMSAMVLKSYVGDLSDAELMQRPGPGCNHLAWQLGHLISSECSMLDSIVPGAAAKLPEGFDEKHSKETTAVDDPTRFCSKQEYLDLMEQVRAASLAALEKIDESELDRPSPEKFREMFPTVGHIFVLIATHGLMHAGQFVPARRALGKPIVI